MLLDRALGLQMRGMGRVRSALRCANATTLVRCQSTDGLTLGLDPDGYLDRFVKETGYYEREVLDAILAQLPVDGLFWDIGANFGLHALTVKKLRPSAEVVAFEPSPPSAARFLANAADNDLGVELYTCALGAEAGYAALSTKWRWNAGLSSMAPSQDETYDGKITCRVERAADIIAQTGRPPHVLKIDVEGYEMEVLRGFGELLSRHKLEAIIFECLDSTLVDITALLTAAGYFITPLPSKMAGENAHAVPNYIATPVA
jgi:FkbM family methyltransferase